MKHMTKRLLSLLLSVTMLFSMTGMHTVFATEGGDTTGEPCPHHAEHTAACYTDELICEVVVDGEQAATEGEAVHTHEQSCYTLACSFVCEECAEPEALPPGASSIDSGCNHLQNPDCTHHSEGCAFDADYDGGWWNCKVESCPCLPCEEARAAAKPVLLAGEITVAGGNGADGTAGGAGAAGTDNVKTDTATAWDSITVTGGNGGTGISGGNAGGKGGAAELTSSAQTIIGDITIIAGNGGNTNPASGSSESSGRGGNAKLTLTAPNVTVGGAILVKPGDDGDNNTGAWGGESTLNAYTLRAPSITAKTTNDGAYYVNIDTLDVSEDTVITVSGLDANSNFKISTANVADGKTLTVNNADGALYIGAINLTGSGTGRVVIADSDNLNMKSLHFFHSTAFDIPASTVGTAITNIDVSSGVPGGWPGTFSASGLPAGISIAPATGIISGTPTAATAAGTATITVTNSVTTPVSKSITIQYGAISGGSTVPVTGISLNKSSTTIAVGGNETLTATITPDDATEKAVTWSSSSEAVATVGTDGKVTAVATGTATITATSVGDNNKKATCTVTVAATTDLSADFTDPAFLAEVYKAVGKTAPAAITAADCAAVTSLDMQNKGIKNLAGLQHFTALETLWVNGNNLTTLDVTGLPLTRLQCHDNILPSKAAVIGIDESKWNDPKFTFDPQAIAIDAVNFPDENFRNWLLDSKNISGFGADGKLGAYELSLISVINVNTKEIKNLKGIELFTALTNLNCNSNQLTSLGTLPAGLTKLDCQNNQLTSLGTLPAGLTELNCSSNQLASLDVGGLSNLITLYCSSNQLASLGTLPAGLTKLYCGYNQLTSLGTLPTGLITLYCSSNSLQSLDVGALSALTLLNCEYNQLTSLTVTGASRLETLRCVQNRLTTLDVSGLSALTTLHCNNNYMANKAAVKGVERTWDESGFRFSPQHTGGFVAVTQIVEVPRLATVNKPLTLTGTALPTNATNQTITEWELYSAGSTGAKVEGNVFTATAPGSAFVRAIIANGEAEGYPYTQQFTITITTSSTPDVSVTGVTLNKSSLPLAVGGNETLTATITPNNATNKAVTWDSSNTAVATVGADGKVTAVAPGTATITVTTRDGNKTATCTVTVAATTYAINVTGGTASPNPAAAGATVALTANPATSGQRFKDWTITPTVTFVEGTSENSQVAKFTMPGGEVTATANYELIPAGETAVTGVTLNKTSLSLYSNTTPNTATLTATVAPTNATNKAVTWASGNTAVATVDQSGNVKAVGNGTAVITVTTKDGGYTANCTVNVSTYSSGGGIGGGGSDTGSNSNSPVITDKPADQPNSPTNAQILVKGSTDNNGKATLNVSDKSVSDAIKAAQDAAKKDGSEKNGISVTIKGDVGASATSIGANLPSGAIAALVKAGVTELRIESSVGTITLDLATLKALEKLGGNVTLSMNRIKTDSLSAAAKTALGNRPAFDFSLTAGGKALTDFGGGNVSIGIPYTPAAGENPANLYGVYVDGAGKVTYLQNSSYDANTKQLRFATGHFSIFGIGYKAAPAFTDIASHWAKDDIIFVAGRGLLTGTSATTFAPNGSMTRGMFVTALGRLAGIDATKYKNTKFTDVAATAYYAPYTAWAAEKGITSGTTATTFSPDKAITRQEMAVLMANYAKAMGYTLPKTREAITFADSDKIASWAKDAVKAMQMAGVLNGKNDNKFDPAATATRAEVAAMLRRYVELVIDTQTAQGLDRNDSGSAMMFESGKLVKSASRTVGSSTYTFNLFGEAALPNKKTGTYTVQKNDSFWLIAQKVGCTMADLEALNGKSRNSIIYAGEVLNVPQK